MYNYLVNTKSLYLHWPFCPYRCHFCPFVALSGFDSLMEPYHKALKTEVERFCQRTHTQGALDSIFMGGGTPSTYPNHLLLDMFGTLDSRSLLSQDTEVTIEVNPGTVQPEQLKVWRSVGINRLSIGVQSLKDTVLKSLNRHQTAEQVYQVLEHASPLFKNISVDLIVGLPGVSRKEWTQLLEALVQWPIVHVSIYFLMVHQGTPLFIKVNNNTTTLPYDDDVVDMYQEAVECIGKHGFEQYEISNFSKRGYQSKHNRRYWSREPYKGCGIGACSFDGTQRLQNEKNIMKYMKSVADESAITLFKETLSREQEILETAMLNLRQTKGMSFDELVSLYGEDKRGRMLSTIDTLRSDGRVIIRDGRLILTPAGLAVENEILLALSS